MKYELRTFKSEDMFVMFNILSKIGFKELKNLLDIEQMKEIVNATTNDDEVNMNEQMTIVGMNVLFEFTSIILSNIERCKDDIYLLLANLSGMTTKEIADLDMVTFTEMIIDVFKKDEFKDFFKVVSKLFN